MTIIYKYTNRFNGKVYVGKTDRPLRERHAEHSSPRSREMSTAFARAKIKYGIASFILETLCEVGSEVGGFC